MKRAPRRAGELKRMDQWLRLARDSFKNTNVRFHVGVFYILIALELIVNYLKWDYEQQRNTKRSNKK